MPSVYFRKPRAPSPFQSFFRKNSGGFTLLELLVVIAVIAILAIVVILILNPAELLKQARDSNRVSDMSTLSKTLSLSSLEGLSLGQANTTYVSISDPAATSSAGDQCQGLGMPASSLPYHCASGQYYRNIDGTGWLPVNLNAISSGAPIGSLSVDPTNQSSTGLYYTYTTDGSTLYELTAKMESQKYQTIAQTDGGQYSDLYEKGTNLTLAAMDFGNASSSGSGSSTWPNGYAYRRTITIDRTKVSSTDQTNFPVLISGTYSYLATAAHGGNATNANGYDIIFTSDASGTSKLNFEQESYASSTGQAVYWVNVPTLSHSFDTPIYLFYNNFSINSDQSNRTGVWDSNYQAVWHLDEAGTGSAGDYKDSTSNGINSATTSSEPAVIAGTIGNAQSFNGSSSIINLASSSLNITGALTISAWVNEAVQVLTDAPVFRRGAANGGYTNDQYYLGATTNGHLMMRLSNGSTFLTAGSFVSKTLLATSTWYYITGTYDGNGTSLIYVNGALADSAVTSSFSMNSASNNQGVAMGGGGTGSYWWNGSIDEVRVSNIARSSGWIATSYNNQSSPSSFYSVGAATTP